MWERYCRGVQAIVYVVDSADPESLEQSKHELHELLDKPSLAGVPVLLLGNKNDLDGALSQAELIDRLDLKVILPTDIFPSQLQLVLPVLCTSAVYYWRTFAACYKGSCASSWGRLSVCHLSVKACVRVESPFG